MKKVTIDKDLCIGCGACTGTAADVFAFGDDGKAEVVGEVTDENASAVEDAAAGCPVQAITVED